jgi:hypothetical protein
MSEYDSHNASSSDRLAVSLSYTIPGLIATQIGGMYTNGLSATTAKTTKGHHLAQNRLDKRVDHLLRGTTNIEDEICISRDWI